MDWVLVFRGSFNVLVLGIFAASVTESLLGKKEGRRSRQWKWILGFLALIVCRFGLDLLSLVFAGFPDSGILSAAENYLTFMMPPIVLLVCTIFIYPVSGSVKAFVSTFASFWGCILREFVYELMRLPFLGGDRGDGLRERPSLWINLVLLVIWLCLILVLYRVCLQSYLRRVLERMNGNMRTFMLIPLLCDMLFIMMLSAIESQGYNITSVNRANVRIFLFLAVVMIALFAMLYWSIFQGVALSNKMMAVQAELDVAGTIQSSILPMEFSTYSKRNDFDIYAAMHPAKEVGGDFYDFYMLDEDHLVLCIADVSGKGIPASLYMMTARTLLRSLMFSGEGVEQVLRIANDRLCENNKAGMFVTVWLGVLEISSGILHFANAGHNPPLFGHGNTWEYLDHRRYKRNIMLGLRTGRAYAVNEIRMEKGDRLVLYTDGVTEANNAAGELYGEERMLNCMQGAANTSAAKNLIEGIVGDVNAFASGAEQFDDITALSLVLQTETEYLKIDAVMDQMTILSGYVEQQLEAAGVEGRILRQMLVVVDEVASNIINYSGASYIQLVCRVMEEKIMLWFRDDGREYNPLLTPAPTLEKDRSQRKIGGFGIHMVRRMTDHLAYRYIYGKNEFYLEKLLISLDKK